MQTPTTVGSHPNLNSLLSSTPPSLSLSRHRRPPVLPNAPPDASYAARRSALLTTMRRAAPLHDVPTRRCATAQRADTPLRRCLTRRCTAPERRRAAVRWPPRAPAQEEATCAHLHRPVRTCSAPPPPSAADELAGEDGDSPFFFESKTPVSTFQFPLFNISVSLSQHFPWPVSTNSTFLNLKC